MKRLKFILLCLIVLAVQPAFAADDTLIPADIKNYIGYGAIMVVLLLVLLAMVVLLRAFKALTKMLLTPEEFAAMEAERKGTQVKKPKAEVINKLLSLKPLSEEESILIAHDFDGIQELDNPTPAWFMGLFYITILFAVAYLLGYHLLGIGQLQDQEYVTEMKVAAKEKEAYLAKAANRVDENSVTLLTDAAALASGQEVFKASCMPCHGDKAQGVVGPNLTDDYWLHGGKINDVFKTIKYGVTAKGMPTWEKQLSHKQIADVASFIKSLHGTNPPGAKEPQGEKETDDATSTAVKTAMVVQK